jgi:outer membrane protein
MKPIAVLVMLFALGEAGAQDLLSTYELALKHDPRLREAEAQRNAVLETKPQSLAKLLPNISASAQMNRNYFNTGSTFVIGQGGFQNFWSSSATLTLNQPIYHHEYWVQLSQADSQIAEAEASYSAAQQDLMLRTAQAYFNVLFAEDSLEYAKAEHRAIERQLEQAKARFEVGLIAITDVNEAQAGYDQARANVIKSENDLDNAREALREIIGESDANLNGLVAEIPLKSPEPTGLEDWDKRAQEGNLDIVAAQSRSETARKNIDLQFSGHLPSVDLVGSAGFVDTNRPRGLRYDSEVIGMQVNLPLFAGGGVNSRVRQARSQLEAALENLDQRRRAVTRQVKNAYRTVLSTISQVQALKAAVTSSQSAVEATEAGFEVGTRTMVEVLTQQRNLYASQRDFAKARYDYIVASLSLKQGASLLSLQDIELVNRWLSSH